MSVAMVTGAECGVDGLEKCAVADHAFGKAAKFGDVCG